MFSSPEISSVFFTMSVLVVFWVFVAVSSNVLDTWCLTFWKRAFFTERV